MANKNFTLDSGLPVTIYKRRGSRNLRLSVNAHGKIRVTIPAWAPYRAGLEFAKARQEWIRAQHKPVALLRNGQAVGKAHRLVLEAGDYPKISTRILKNTVLVRYPEDLSDHSDAVQTAAREACVRALRQQAAQLLPQRLQLLAAENGFEYNAVSVKRLKGRWGSCDHRKNIVLNLFLMQLPWDLIDYVLLHELTHTKVLRHGPGFWAAMSHVLPSFKERKKRLRDHNPVLGAPEPAAVMA